MENGCRIEGTIQLISKKWTLMIIKTLMDHETRRYKELAASLNGISPKTLSDRLKELEREGIIKRESFPEIPPRVEYSLTEKGAALGSALQGIVDWSGRWAGV